MIDARSRLTVPGCVWDTAQLHERPEEAPGIVRFFQYTMAGRLPFTIKSSRLKCTGLTRSRVLWAGLSETRTSLYENNSFCRNEAGVFPAPDISVSPELAIMCLPGIEHT